MNYTKLINLYICMDAQVRVTIIDMHEAPELSDGSVNTDEDQECTGGSPCQLIDFSDYATD